MAGVAAGRPAVPGSKAGRVAGALSLAHGGLAVEAGCRSEVMSRA